MPKRLKILWLVAASILLIGGLWLCAQGDWLYAAISFTGTAIYLLMAGDLLPWVGPRIAGNQHRIQDSAGSMIGRIVAVPVWLWKTVLFRNAWAGNATIFTMGIAMAALGNVIEYPPFMFLGALCIAMVLPWGLVFAAGANEKGLRFGSRGNGSQQLELPL